MRTWKALAAAAALLAGLAGAPAADAQAPVKVKQAGFKVIDLAVPFIAKSEASSRRTGSTGVRGDRQRQARVAALLSGNAQFTDFAVDDTAALQRKARTRSWSTAWSTRSPWTW